MKEGKPIWVESLMTTEEWKQMSKKYHATYNSKEPTKEFDCDFKWRKGMGDKVSTQEIAKQNAWVDDMLRKANITT